MYDVGSRGEISDAPVSAMDSEGTIALPQRDSELQEDGKTLRNLNLIFLHISVPAARGHILTDALWFIAKGSIEASRRI